MTTAIRTLTAWGLALALTLAPAAPSSAMVVLGGAAPGDSQPPGEDRAGQETRDNGTGTSPSFKQKGIVSTPDGTVIVRPKKDNTE